MQVSAVTLLRKDVNDLMNILMKILLHAIPVQAPGSDAA